MANQSGWVIPCPATVSMKWNGKDMPDALTIKVHDGPKGIDQFIVSHFGSGIVTFRLPWLFRTPPKIGLFVRGATNYPKDYAVPLDGLVETDWSPSTFTMNWKVMKRGTDVWFRKGEPICMIMPYPLALLEWTEPGATNIEKEPVTQKAYLSWAASRQQAITRHQGGQDTWQKDYMKGQTAGGTVARVERVLERQEVEDVQRAVAVEVGKATSVGASRATDESTHFDRRITDQREVSTYVEIVVPHVQAEHARKR
ncbi:Uncharacterized protein SCF082_LOCUS36898, partial [Durusdinium trenchii]